MSTPTPYFNKNSTIKINKRTFLVIDGKLTRAGKEFLRVIKYIK
jgi:hypothetical protein